MPKIPPPAFAHLVVMLGLLGLAMGCKGASLADQLEKPAVGQRSGWNRPEGLPRPVIAKDSALSPTPTTPNTGSPFSPDSAKPGQTLVPPIPMPARDLEISVDDDAIVATVNGKVLSLKDLRRDVHRERKTQLAISKAMSSLPWQTEATRVVDESERQELAQLYNRLVQSLVFRLAADDLRPRLGSIPKEQIDAAIDEARKRHGVDGNSPEANRRWLDLLRQNNLTFFDFQRQVRDSLEGQRVTQFYAFAPDQRLGETFDISPGEMMAEFLRSPIVATRNIEVHLARFPLLLESQAEKERQQRRAQDFLKELNRKFEELTIRERVAPQELPARKAKVFVDLARAYLPDTPHEPKTLATLDAEEADIAEEIRRTAQGEISSPIIGETSIVIVFVRRKDQAGFETYASPAVQRELEQRLLAQKWNAFRNQVVEYLKGKATVVSWEEGLKR